MMNCKRFIVMQSTKPNKNGHVPHLVFFDSEGYAYEISPKTGKKLRYGELGTLDFVIDVRKWEIIDPKDARFVGGWDFPFFEYLKEKNLITSNK